MQLQLENADCNISDSACLLTAGELELSIYLEQDVTVVNTTFPMYRLSLFTIDTEGQAQEFPLGMRDSPYYWRADMALKDQLNQHPNGLPMRIIAQYEKDSFIAEFMAR